jgi:hypothetical protein
MIYKFHFDFDWVKLKPICEELIDIEKSQMNLVNNGKTSYVNDIHPHNIDEFKPFFKLLTFTLNTHLFNSTHFIGNSWVNVHHSGGKTIEHNHPNVDTVAAAYLHMPENGGYFEYKENLKWKEIPTISGDVLIFPGTTNHRTQINQSSEDRWVLTTNLII